MRVFKHVDLWPSTVCAACGQCLAVPVAPPRGGCQSVHHMPSKTCSAPADPFDQKNPVQGKNICKLWNQQAFYSEMLDNTHKHNYTETHGLNSCLCPREGLAETTDRRHLQCTCTKGSSFDLTLCFFSKSSASPVSFKQPRAFFSTLSSSCLDSSNLLLRQLLASSCLLHSPTSFSKAWEDGGSGNYN